MIDIKHKRCEHPECKSHPSYNFEGQVKAKFCKEHKELGMIDIKHKRCEHPECKTSSSYGYCSQGVSHCAQHKNEKMFVRPNRQCSNDNCQEIATYGITEPCHCEAHQIEKEICLLGQKCQGCCRNDEILNKEGMCLNYCAPDDTHKKIMREKKKEKLVLKYLDEYIRDVDILSTVDDKVFDSSCDMCRPDRLYDLGTHYVIVEVDEEQHKKKRSSCSLGEIGELRRMYNIRNALGMNCIFLRFNPDKFKVSDKEIKINMNERLKKLCKWIDHCFKMKLEDYSKVKYKKLFYDEYNEINITFKEIDYEDVKT